jgi:EAL domain-containing protein (putative c-di-GMP-specific phosphodiesterase class I)
VQLWVDDFGTGYSSLIYLRRLPIDGLKIDRSFVGGLTTSAEDRVIVESIVSLGHSLGLAVLAEGVETEQQADRLRDLGCDLAQGFLWSAAEPAGG